MSRCLENDSKIKLINETINNEKGRAEARCRLPIWRTTEYWAHARELGDPEGAVFSLWLN